MGLDGALLIDKPSGPTSHDIVAFVRRTLKISRVGHTGTLDPLATGLLVILVGHATRLSQFLVADEKEYLADVRLGIATPTYDSQSLPGSDRGQTRVRPGSDPGQTGVRPGSDQGQTGVRPGSDQGQTGVEGGSDPGSGIDGSGIEGDPGSGIERVLAEFRGTFLQTPPPFSAKKVEGVRAYEKARKQQPLELKPVEVTVHDLETLPVNRPLDPDAGSGATLLRLRVAASSGFYVRSLAHDIGQRLGCGAHLEALRRTRAGRFRIEQACSLDAIERGGTALPCLLTMNTLLADMPAVTLTAEGLRRAGNGNKLAPHHVSGRMPERDGHVRLLNADGEVLAVAERRPDGLLHPLVVLR